MKYPFLTAFFVISWALPLVAQTQASTTSGDGGAESSSSSLRPTQEPVQVEQRAVRRTNERPFHSVAVAAKIGSAGIGFDLATPINRFLNLRGGAQFFDHTANPNADGIHSTGNVTLQNVNVVVDVFPFRNSSFHLSPGVTLHNDTHIASSLYVPAGYYFTLGDTAYMSNPDNPIYGDARLRFGNTVAPRFTVGWGSMLPRRGGHISVPFDIGFQYISSPVLELQLHGSACDGHGNCSDINSSDGPTNLQTEVNQLNRDLSGLRFFPIVSVGVAFSFGH